jgi:carbonic anhydrase/acetyltransferase-like protein (isoleucine patch superfamily)
MIYAHLGRWPKIHETAFVAPSADVIGDVEIGELSSIWFQVVIRGDVNSIRIGKRTNIQDHSMLHVTRKTSPLKVGDDVTVGHRVLLHGCTIGSRVLVGMGAIIMDDAEIGDDCVIGAGALVTRGKKIPSGSLVMGAPGKVVREINPEERGFLLQSSENYVRDSADYRSSIRSPERYGADKRDLEDFSGGDLE